MNKIIAADSETETSAIIDDKKTIETPPTHLIWSIVNCVCSTVCLVGLAFNVTALKYSLNTRRDIQAGDFIRASKHSKQAKKCNQLSTSVCVSTFLVVFIVLVFAFIHCASKLNQPRRPVEPQQIAYKNNVINVTKAILGSWQLVIIFCFIKIKSFHLLGY